MSAVAHISLRAFLTNARYLEMCEDAGCIRTRALLLTESVEESRWSAALASCSVAQENADKQELAHTVVIFDIGGPLTKASFVTFQDWKQQQSANVSWQAYTNVSFSSLKFENEKERSVISNNFIICPERGDACQEGTHLRMRLAEALWTTINMTSRH